MYGIENLKEVGTDVAKFGMKLEEALEDKKLSFAEAVSLGVFAVPKALEHVGDAAEIAQEIKDLDGTETTQLVVHIADALDLVSDKVENIVEKGFAALAALNELRLAVKEARPA